MIAIFTRENRLYLDQMKEQDAVSKKKNSDDRERESVVTIYLLGRRSTFRI
jgi:hypothetical protein